MSLSTGLASLLAPLVTVWSTPDEVDRFLRELGVLAGPSAPAPAPPVLTDLAAAAQASIEAVRALDGVSAADRAAGLADALTGLFDAVGALGDVRADGLEPPFDAPELWPLLAERLPDWLLTSWLRDHHRTVYDQLDLLDVATVRDGVAVFDFDRLVEVVGDLGGALAGVLTVDLGVLLAPLRRGLGTRGATIGSADFLFTGQTVVANEEAPSSDPNRVDVAVPVEVGNPGLAASAEAVDGAEGPGLALTVEGLDRIAGGIELHGGWTVTATGGPGLGGVVLGPSWAEALDGATLDSAAVALTGRPTSPWALVGDPGATRLELASVSGELGGSSLTGAPEVELAFGTSGLRLVIVPGDADSFLAALLGGEISASLALAGRWSSRDGMSVDGAAGLSVFVATTVTLGPLTLSGLTLALAVEDGVVALLVTTEITGQVGPISASVRGMGLRAELLPGTTRGSGVIPLGPVALAVGFQPPNGAAISIDLGAAGGGWIDFDLELGRYSGVIDLDLFGVGICAVVLIDTKALASGEWSLFFALFIDVPVIQLGFGFTLTGVGGLFGFNRVLERAALESAVRSGSLDTVLFPPDPIGDAPEVIAELSALFPPSDDSYVFGPVVRIGWGTPTLIEAELGIVVSLPDPIVIAVLGSVTSVLPTKDLDLVALHLDVSGVVDATAGTLSIDASLHDSHVVGFALAGDMAVRAAFLEQPSFLMALGGFHPGFEEPDGFPSLRRLSLGLSAAPVLDISFECYLAITSNSVQFGSQFELSAEIAGFGIEGGASFDALVEFSPFRLATRLGFYVAITAVGVDLAGVWLDASVEGPNPWLVVGTARFKILGIEEEVRVDERIGDREPEPAVEPEDLLDALVTALSDEGAWAVIAGTSPGVVVTGPDPVTGPVSATSAPDIDSVPDLESAPDIDSVPDLDSVPDIDSAPDLDSVPEPVEGPPPDELVALPDGMLTVSQRAVPLGLRLDKAGDAPLEDHDTFEVEASGSLTQTGSVQDWFAPGYFFELGAGEQLSAPSFERLQSGIEFGGGDVVAGTARTGTLEFEEILRDPELGEEGTDRVVVDLGDRTELLVTMAGARRPGGFQIAEDPELVSLAPSSYAVTDRESGHVMARMGSWSAAHQSAPGQRAGTTIVPGWEALP